MSDKRLKTNGLRTILKIYSIGENKHCYSCRNTDAQLHIFCVQFEYLPHSLLWKHSTWMDVIFFLMGHLSDVYICYTIQSIDEMFISMMCVRCVCVCLFWWDCFLPVESEREMNKTNIYGNHFITTTQIYSSSNIIFDFSFGHNQIITKYHFNIPLNFRPLDSVRQHSAFSKMYVYCLLMFSYKKVRIPLSIVTSSLRLGFSSSMFVSVSISTSYQSIPTFNIWFDL